MFGMTRGEKSRTRAGIAAERAAIEVEIEGSTLLTAYAETVASAAEAEGRGRRFKSGHPDQIRRYVIPVQPARG